MLQTISNSAIFKLISGNPLLLALSFIVVGVLGLAWIFLLLDCLIRNFEHHCRRITGHPKWDKLIWFIIVLTGFGAFVYYFRVRRRAPHI